MTKINIAGPFILAFMLWVGFTGHVSWWVILAIFISHCEVNIKW
jgi:hypothetical protein